MRTINKDSIQSFISENKLALAALGGIATGIAVTALLGNERAKNMLLTLGTSLKDVSGKLMDDFGGLKDMLSPLLAKNAQGL